jgi:hypothetical protein
MYPDTKFPFLGPKNIFKIFLAAVSTRYYHRKKNKKTQVVPGTKYGVFRYTLAENLFFDKVLLVNGVLIFHAKFRDIFDRIFFARVFVNYMY